MSIPKKIHYVWLGDKALSARDKGFIEDWQKLNPDFKIRHWTDKDVEVSKYPLLEMALEEKVWALAADIIRMVAVYEEGGIYMDTDVELLKPLSPFLKYDGFAGWESDYWFTTAMFGACKNSPWIEKVLKRYEMIDVKKKITTNTFLKTVHSPSVYAKDVYGIELDGKTAVYADGKFLTLAPEYLSPKHYMSGELNVTENTVAIHHYASTWHTKTEKLKDDVVKATYDVLGQKYYGKLEKMFNKSLEKKIRKELT